MSPHLPPLPLPLLYSLISLPYINYMEAMVEEDMKEYEEMLKLIQCSFHSFLHHLRDKSAS